ncbi:hypothetical protein AKUA2003_13470 [Apilactobacillus kunkeei]|nr:hypothetical protein AKUA1001_13500 [Apilactobacillus kunkeei]CAI2659760.1 hypothetical protein AKUA2003_13470 [Apilactobacillus kunkeei]CAI2803398.1 hypothetical protein AKUA2002_13490 [Apilactobacillus kunkeei]
MSKLGENIRTTIREILFSSGLFIKNLQLLIFIKNVSSFFNFFTNIACYIIAQKVKLFL